MAAVAVDQADDLLVGLADEHHLDDVHGRPVGDPHAAHETRLDAELLQHRADLRAAAVHDHRVQADELQQHDVLREAVLQRSSIIAWPPYFTTTVLFAKRRM